MSTTARAAASSLALTLLLGACTGAPAAPPREPAATTTAAPGTDESLREEALALVEARERALTERDRGAFLATVDPDELGFSATQARWFDNLAELPVGAVSYELGDEDLMAHVDREGDLQLPVDFTMRLRGFDRRPVTRSMVWTFVRRGDDVLLADDRDPQVEKRTGWTPAPWDLAHTEVRRAGGILAVFDEDTVLYADSVMADLTAATEAVRGHLPAWSGRFVAYGVTDVSVMEEMSPMPVDDTAGVAFPVLSRKGGPVAAYRFMVNPTVVTDNWGREQVIRHEVVHVAMGTSDDRSPVWLVEGIAEYVARSVLPVEERRLAALVVLGTATGRFGLEPGRRFYTRNPTANYTLAALVCDHLATTRGEDVLWDLVRTFRTTPFTTWSEAEDILRRELGLSSQELAVQALLWARTG